jgi:pimeloyl-ACP methyl ester carboxylesterase
MTTQPTSTTHRSANPAATTSMITTEGTSLSVTRRGSGPPLLLIHGGGENANMHAAQAADLSSAGFEVITYDRRGTGRSGREDWPGSGAAQHADDAAGLLRELGVGPATIVGVSSGGVLALSVAARHPEVVHRAIAWEPPAASVVPGGAEFSAELMRPINEHLVAHPGDFVGAQAILLSFVLGFPVRVDDPAFAEARTNAEPMVRDDPTITLASFTEADFRDVDVTLAVGSAPNELIAAALPELARLTGSEPVAVEGEHQIYLTDPSVLTSVVTGSVH